MQPATIERRFSSVEVRATDDSKVIVGRCCEYGQVSELLYGYFTEEIAPGAFDESLVGPIDVYCSVDHDVSRVLGRVSAKTLALKPDDRGIAVECPLPAYSYAVDLLLAIQRRDLRGMSFIFDVKDDRWKTRDGVKHRVVTKADLYEVAFVFFPAYPETTAGVRFAFPVAGELRAIEKAKLLDWKEEYERCRRRLRLALAV